MSHLFHIHHKPSSHPDVVLIGAGIMSATIGLILKELHPSLKIEIYERLDSIAAESSDAMNNAGTGHSAFCELNYTPQKENGEVDCSKAIKIAEQFEVSKQFWSYLVKKKYITDPHLFINSIPHLSFVWGDENVAFLKKRFDNLSKHAFFKGMEYSEEHSILKEWMPLIMKDRDKSETLAATRMTIGTDINFGNLTRAMFESLKKMDGVSIHLSHDVVFLEKMKFGHWEVEVENLITEEKRTLESKFVFIGAGGGSLPLLEESDIEEAEGYGGFPVSGQWLVCKNEEVIKQHNQKVYGKASVGAPPMSVPHLDTRIINGKKELLFGPFAGFSTKFLKHGSSFDLLESLEFSNLFPMLSAGWHNLPLTKYLIDQVRQSPEERLEALKQFVPDAKLEDWVLENAGQRVQVIKKDEEEGGKLEFGTEIVNATDGTIAALLGASPGASTSVSIILDVLHRCFKSKMESDEWLAKLKEMIPSYGISLAKDEVLIEKVRKETNELLDLKH
jgi:malate dehydrogenase (quinone)